MFEKKKSISLFKKNKEKTIEKEQKHVFGSASTTEGEDGGWKVLIVDDETDVHTVTRLVLREISYQGKGLNLLSAYSAREAKEILQQHSDIALILLDVVMETQSAGLDLIKEIRDHMKNPFVSIVLRTGQPGQAPERKVIKDYGINDYKAKSELTTDKLYTLVLSNLRAYEAIRTVEDYRQNLEAKVKERTEKLEHAVKRLKEFHRERDEFLAVATSDFKNPLTSILGMTQLLRAQWQEFPKKQVDKFLNVIEDSGHQMMEMMTNYLDLGRLETGNVDFNFQPFDLRYKVDLVVDKYQPSALAKKITIQTEVEGKFLVWADGDGVERVLDNLLSNAIKFSPQGTCVQIKLSKNETGVRCAIQDEGPGLSDDDKRQLFRKFVRLSALPTGGENSTGLGLATAKKLMEYMKGRIWAESEGKGKGSVFFVELPQPK